MGADSNCVFCRIVRGEIPSQKVFESDDILVFKDINPVAPVHLLMIPKEHIDSMADLADLHVAVMGRMMVLANRVAQEQGSTGGFRLIVNTGTVGRQDVFHLHAHILGGPKPLPGMIARTD